MQLNVSKIDKYSFNDAATLLAATMAETSIPYTRSEAVAFLMEHGESTIVLSVGGAVMGVYSYTDNPNVFILNFFALNPHVRRSRPAYALYKDMAERLSGKPVIAPVETWNAPMISVVERRGTFLGRFPAVNGQTIDYYSIDFRDEKGWKK